MLAKDRYRRHRILLPDYLAALLLMAGYLALLMSTMDIGYTRDEGYYFGAGTHYYGWFEELEENRAKGHPEDSFTQENIDRHWEPNPEHPVLMKTLFGLSWHAFSQEDDLMTPVTALRFPAAVFSALLMPLVFLFVVEAFGSRGAGLLAAVSVGFMPRYFFHAHLACFDAPMTTMWFLVIYAYWKSYHSRAWALLTGVFFGLALITKLNAFFLPVVMLLHWFFAGLRQFRLEGRGKRLRLRLPSIPSAFLSAAILGPLIFYLGWPRHWFDTFTRITDYIGRHWHHEHYFVQYFGEALVRPPFPVSFPVVMTLVTVPAITLLTALMGGSAACGEWLARLRRRRRARSEGATARVGLDRRGTGILIALNIALPIAIIAQPSSPVFGGTKHWMQAMPFLAVLSGWGAIWAFRRVWPKDSPHRLVRAIAVVGFLAILSAPMIHATLAVHPFGTGYYNELIGGVRGAADRGMMRQYWGYATRAALDTLNREAPEGASVFTHNTTAWGWYVGDGLVRDDIHEVPTLGPHGLRRANYALFNHQRSFLNTELGTGRPGLLDIWRRYDTMAPIAVWGVDGVPMLSLYGERRVREPQAELAEPP